MGTELGRDEVEATANQPVQSRADFGPVLVFGLVFGAPEPPAVLLLLREGRVNAHAKRALFGDGDEGR